MNYSDHRITKSGHIELREEYEGQFHRSVIAPNQELTKYNDIIEADPDWKKYRTKENADAYEARLEAEKPTQEELDRQEAQRLKKEKQDQLREELRNSRAPQSNPALAARIEKLEYILGIRDEL